MTAGRVLVAEHVPPGLIEVPQHLRGDARDERRNLEVIQNWRGQLAQTLSEQSRKLSDAREALNKALLRRQLIELRADSTLGVPGLLASMACAGCTLQRLIESIERLSTESAASCTASDRVGCA